MTVACVDTPAIDLSQSAQPFHLQQLGRPLQLGEVSFYSRIGQR